MSLVRGKFGWLMGFVFIAALVIGGLGWVTREALRMEDERRHAAAERERERLQKEQDERWHDSQQLLIADQSVKIRQALMLLDIRISSALAREDSRPYTYFEALHSPFPAITQEGVACEPGQMLIPSPLMTATLPEWMLLHFQVDPVKGWTSPQVVPDALQRTLRKQPIELAMNNVDDAHNKRLEELKAAYSLRNFYRLADNNGLSFDIANKETQQAQQDLKDQVANSANPTNQSTSQNAIVPSQQPALQLQNGNTFFPQYLYGNDNTDANNKRYQIINRGRNEGLWGYNGDGRNYSSLQGLFPYKLLESKQAEIRTYEQQMKEQPEAVKKKDLQAKVDSLRKESDDLRRALQPIEIEVASMKPLWLPSPEEPKHLLMVRPARIGTLPAYQGILIDWPRLQEILKSEIDYLFPEARFRPLAKNNPEHLDREMTALPIEFDAGPLPEVEAPESLPAPETQPAGWTPLRIGLATVWAAALIALIAVGLGGWSLLDLSERRIRFVSAVTHELRTPLTTLRLYLDLLNSGMVSEEKQKDEYLKTLSGEADRLHRLIGNVLDFARLEKARPNVVKQPVAVAEFLDQLCATWHERCAASGKDVQVVNALPEGTNVSTDRSLVEQILGNLIDNARKYSRDASDPRIWLRARADGGKIILEVEDRGPGVTKRERGSIFRPFRRGHDADVKAGGVGLGLALATRWAGFIGGKLNVKAGEDGVGACFQLELPS